MFTATQARVLEEMGYQVLVRPLPAAATEPSSIASPLPPAPASSPRQTPIRAAAVAVPSGPGQVLWDALLTAAALTPARAEANGLRRASSGVAVKYLRDELWIDPVALRRDARGKRGLWKTLRALRRAELGRADG
jgi:hypothetical protein